MVNVRTNKGFHIYIYIYIYIVRHCLTKNQSFYYILSIFSGGLDSNTTCNLSGIVEIKTKCQKMVW